MKVINPDVKLVEELEKITAKVRDLSGRIDEKVEIKTCIDGIRGTVKPETVRWGKRPTDW